MESPTCGAPTRRELPRPQPAGKDGGQTHLWASASDRPGIGRGAEPAMPVHTPLRPWQGAIAARAGTNAASSQEVSCRMSTFSRSAL